MRPRSIALFVVLAVSCTPFMLASEQKSDEKALREYYDLQEGKRLYEQYCRFCHGDQVNPYLLLGLIIIVLLATAGCPPRHPPHTPQP